MKAKLFTFVRGLKNGTPPRFQSYLKSLTLLLVMGLSVNMWGADYTGSLEITISNFTEITTSYTTKFTHEYTINKSATETQKCTIEAYGVYKNSNGIQMNSGKGTYIKNTSAFPGYITSIECTWTATGKNSPTLYVNNGSVASTSSTNNLGKGSNTTTTQTYTVTDASTSKCNYFYFDGTTITGACYLSKLKINYTVAAATPVTSLDLYVAGQRSDLKSGKNVGGTYTLPTEVNVECGTKSLVGWSTVTIPNPSVKPTSNFYEPGEEVTLAANNTFYAVFADASGSGATTWNLVSDVASLTVGSKVVIADAGSTNYAISTTQNNNNRGQAEITKSASPYSTITFAENAGVQIFEVKAGTKSNTIAFYTGSGYIYAASSSNNHLKTEEDLSDNSSWTVTITENKARISANGTYTHKDLKYNSSSSIFSCYSGGADLFIYKKTGGTTYSNYTTTCRSLESISVKTNPTQSFTKGDAFSAAGLVITENYDNGDKVDVAYNDHVNDFSFSGYDMNTTGNQTVTITYKGKTTTYDINVAAPTACKTPTFSVAADTYTGAQSVELACETDGATIYYTIDGTDPTTSSEVYSSAINVKEDMTIKAFAAKEGLTSSAVVEAIYVINYTVTFNMKGHGSAPSQITNAKYNQTITAPTEPSVIGYTFEGWYKETECTNVWNFASDKITESITLFAKWTEKKFDVILLNSGNQVGETLHIQEGATLGTNLPTLTETDACDPHSTTFVGWTSAQAWEGKVASFNNFVTSETTVTEAMTLNAVWATKEGNENQYKRVKQLSELSAGTKIVIIDDHNSKIFKNNLSSADAPTESNDLISVTSSTDTWTLGGNSTDGWTLSNSSGKLGIATLPTSNSNNKSKPISITNTNSTWTIGTSTATGISNCFYIKSKDHDAGLEFSSNNWIAYYNNSESNMASSTWFTERLYIPSLSYSNYLTTCSTAPLIEVSTTELSGFSTIATTGNPSAAQSFTVEGYNLTENTSVTAPTGYEVCLTEAGSYTSSVELPQAGGTVYVRLAAAEVANPSVTGDISLTSTGATTKNIALTGEVIAAVTVTFNNNGSTDGAPAAIKLAQGGTLGSNLPGVGSMTAPITGYSFVGWVNHNNAWTGFESTLTQTLITGNEIIDTDITYDAVWAKGSNDFELMGNSDPFTDGNYIITYDSYNGLKAMGNVVSGSNITTIGVDDQDEGIIANNTEAKVVWTLRKTGTNTVTFYNADKGQYLQGTSSALSFTNTPVNWTWSMTPGEDDYAPKFTFSIGTNGLYYLSNEFQYHSSPDPLYIYKQQISNYFVTTPNEYTVTWHRGNAEAATTPAFEGQTFADIAADAPEVADNAAGDCANKFMGWATSAITKDEATEEDVSWANETTISNSNKDFYAVFAQAEGTVAQTAKITPTDISGWKGLAYATSYNKTSADGTTWSMQGVWTNSSGVNNLQMNNTSNRAITTPQFASNITKIEFNAKGQDITIYDASGNEIKSQSLGSTTDDYVIDMSDVEYNQVKIANKTSGVTNIYSLTITYGSASYSNYVTQCTPKYDVKFYTDNGTTQYGETQSIEENRYATAPDDPENDCSNFNGWSKTWGGDVVTVGEVQITMPTNFYAVWDAIKPVLEAEFPKDNGATQGFDAADLKVIVSAPTAGTCLTYQWQKSINATTGFEDILGATASTYTPSTVEANTTYYRCVVTNGNKSTTSRVATFSVAPVTKCFAPSISIATGKAGFIRSTLVTLTTETEGATIYYTTDGTTAPSAETSQYTEPFTITDNTTIKAIAIKAEMTNSDVATATFYKAELQNIEVETAPAKVTYDALETFDPTDLVITATYNYDLSEEIDYANHSSEFTFNPSTSTPLNVTDKKVIIGWGEKEVDLDITVNCIEIAAPDVVESRQGSTGITLTWSAVDNAASYQVKWNGGEAEDATSPYVKTGLTDNTNYTYEVIAVGKTNYCTSTTGVQNVKTNSKSCVSIDNAQIDKTPADFYVGESIEASQFKVDKHYDNGDVVTEAPSKAEIVGVTNPLTDAEVGTQTVTLTFNNKTTTIEITVKPQPVVTWSINGNEDNKQSFAYNADLVLPEAPAAPQTCAEKTFVGWTTETYKDHDSDEAPAVLFTEAGDRKVTEDVTYYAVFAMVENAEINTVLTEVFDDNQTTDSNSEFDKNTFSNFNGNCSKAYKSQYGGIKLGSGSAIGYITSKELNLSKPTTITFDVKQYKDDEKSITVTIINSENQTESVSKSYSCTTENSETAVLNFESSYAKALVKFTTTSSSHRIYFDNVKIEAGGETIITAYSTTCAARTPQSIAITHEATTKTFDVNDAFTSEGLEITAYYDSGDPQVVTDYCTITAPDMTTVGEKDVNISYTENDETVNTSYKINVRQPYYVMYESNGATGSVPSDTKKYYTDEKVTVLANESLVKTNNVFKGWSYAGTTYQAGEQVTVGTENITLTAVWEEKMPCTITLSENGNTSTVTDKFTGDNYTLPATITNNVTGYAFMGWSIQEINEPVATTEPGTFFAKGEQITLTESAYTFYAIYARTSGTSSDYNAGKITTDADIVAGGLYIFAMDDYAMNNTVENSAVQMTQNFAKTGLSSTDAIVFTLESATDGYYIKNSDGKYLHNGSGTGISLQNSAISSTAIWTFSYNTQQTSNAWQIQNSKNSNRFLGNPDASTHTIKAYATSNWATCPHAITIYRLVGGYTTAPTITVNGTTVQEVPADFHGNVIVENGGDVTLSAATTWKNLTIKNGGKVTTNAALTIKDLLIETKMGSGTGTTKTTKASCGQLIIGADGSVTASGTAIVENQIAPTGTASEGWYTFSVPFPVNAQNGIYYGETKLVNGYDYAIMEYLGDVRAQGQYGWKKYSGILQPGKMYVIAVADTDYGKLRFKKTADGDLISTNSWPAGIYGGGEETDANWNAIGNPNLAISQFVNNSGANTLQLYDHANNTFTVYEKGELNIVVGSGFFIQAVAEHPNITMNVKETTTRGYRAPAEEVEEKPFIAVQLLQGETMNDQVFLNADANASLSYEIGRDVAKIFMQGDAKCAQIYVPAYGTNLCAAQFPLNANNEALFPLTLTAPKKGVYTIAAENVPEGVNLFLEQDGALIWNLNNSAYEIYLNKGETNEYSIRLVANSPLAPTGSETIEAEDNAQKLIINSNFYIIKNGSVYSAQGQLVK